MYLNLQLNYTFRYKINEFYWILHDAILQPTKTLSPTVTEEENGKGESDIQ